MLTTKIQIKPFLAEYAKAKFAVENEEYIQFQDTEYLYHVIYNLMIKRPANVAPVDSGNLEIALPHRPYGKNPETHNYIPPRSELIIEKKLNRLFFAQMQDFVDEQVEEYGQPINESVFMFMHNYNIKSISEDALLKSYYRWRERTRQKIRKRKYTRS